MVKRYKNGNIDVKLDNDVLQQYKAQRLTDRDIAAYVLNELSDVDCCILGEPYSLGNFSMAYDLYCYYNDLVYIFSGISLQRLLQGSGIKLAGRKPTLDDLAKIKNL